MRPLAHAHEHRPLLVLMFVAALTAVAGGGLWRLSFEDEPRNMFRRDDADFDRMEQLFAEFHVYDNDILLVVRSDDIFAPQSIDALRELVTRLREIPTVSTTYSLFDVRRPGKPMVPLVPYTTDSVERLERARREAHTHSAIPGRLLSENDGTTLVVATIAGDSLDVAALEATVEPVRRLAREISAETPLEIMVSGIPLIRVDSLTGVQRDQFRFTLLAMVFATALSWFLFDRWAAVVVAMSPPVVGVIWTLGLMGWAGVRINGLNMMLPTLVLVVGLTDSVHVLAETRRGLMHHLSPRRAAAQAVRYLGPACALTSLTTAIGFGSLAIGQTLSVRQFGWVCASGCALSFLAVMTMVPLLVGTPLGRRIAARPSRHLTTRELRQRVRLVAFLMRWPVPKSLAALVLAAVLVPAFARLTPDITWTEAIPSTSDTIQALRTLDREFGGSLPVFVVLEWPADVPVPSSRLLAAVNDVHRILEGYPLLGSPHSVINLLDSFPGGMGRPAESWPYLHRMPDTLITQYIQPDSRRLVVSVRVPDSSAAALQPMWVELNRDLAEFQESHPGFSTHLTGSLVVAGQNLRTIIDDLRSSLALAAVIVGGLMAVVFRSLLVGLAAVIPNAFPLLINAAILAYGGTALTLTSVLTFSLCLGLAVDDTIHFVMRFQREREAGCSVRTAVRRAYFHVGAVLLATTAILLTGFGVLLLSDVPAVRLFAGLSCVAMITALLSDLIVLPAMLLCLVRDKRGSA